MPRTIQRRGHITAGTFQADVRFRLHVDDSGRASLVEFDKHPDALEDGTLVLLEPDDGRALRCQVIDGSPFCAIVGDDL